MTIYWLLFGYAAIMALAYPVDTARHPAGMGRSLALIAFVLFYVLIGALRHETGGDWETYQEMFADMESEPLSYAMSVTDPLFGTLNWISAQFGLGIYLVNGICCLILGTGTVLAATRMREPWLAILIAVPYLLIVVGMGYIRQGAAIGLMLMALAQLDRSRPAVTIVYLLLATGFHSSAALIFPLFAWSLVSKNKVMAVVLMIVGSLAFMTVLVPRIDSFEAGYLDAEYDSGGAAARILMSVVPSVLVLARWRNFSASKRVRAVWMTIAVANFVALAALVLSPSSTAVDRIALFFSVIQLAAFGEIRSLAGISDRMVLLTRFALIGTAAAVQSVWLVFGTHAYLWVPYQSVLFL